MPNIIINPSGQTDRVCVEYSPEEVLPKTLYKFIDGDLQIVGVVGDAIGTSAWRDLLLNSNLTQERKFKHQNTQFINGKYRVTFYEQAPPVSDPPGSQS